MWRRIVQFFREMTHRRPLDRDEAEWVQRHLSPAEQALFMQMSLNDQHHAVTVSMRVIDGARRHGITDENKIRTLIRSGLLHDIGRVRGDVGILDKVLVVLIRRLFPRIAKRLEAAGAEEMHRSETFRRRIGSKALLSGVKRAFYTQAVHPYRGAHMASLWGVEQEVARLIRCHHHPFHDDLLLRVLAEADR